MAYRVLAEMPERRPRGVSLWKALAIVVAVLVGIPTLCMGLFVAFLAVSGARSEAAVRTFCATTPPVGATADVPRLAAMARELGIDFERDAMSNRRAARVNAHGGSISVGYYCWVTIVDGRVTEKLLSRVD